MKIVLGVTGCIGAYKSAIILRLLQRTGFEVLPVMTRHAKEFIGSVTLEKLSGNKVISDLFNDQTTRIEHIALARQSHLLLVAPATANILGKFAHGIGDDFLSTLYLSTTTPVVVAPAMNVEMWNHVATQENLKILEDRGVVIVEPDSGYLACGEEGAGRLAEPEKVVEGVLSTLENEKSLLGKRVLVTAGPTIEDIDPVRFISNRSSGKMGYSIAREAHSRGAQVVLVSGPCQLEVPVGVELVKIRSASEMARVVFERAEDVDVVVMAAAVSDYSPDRTSLQKIKKSNAEMVISLKRTVDILGALGEKDNQPFLVGFAAESDDLHTESQKKLQEKKLDLIVGNNISVENGGFQSDLNQVIVIDRQGSVEELPLLSKVKVARILWDRIEDKLDTRKVRSNSE